VAPKANRRRLGPLAAGLVLALSGCGSGSRSTGTTAHGGARFFGGHPGQAETRAHIGRADCRRLSVRAQGQLGKALRFRSEPTPPSSHCLLNAPGVHISIYLDAAYAARQRYQNRMTEQVQFNAPHPARVPHPVPGVGDPAPGNQWASWIPAYSTLFAVRGNRWLTVAYSTAARPPASDRRDAIGLAREAFRLSAGGSHSNSSH
jgi:hypothetical protein